MRALKASPRTRQQFSAAGSLTRPGPIGRIVRLLLGLLCLLALWAVIANAARIVTEPVSFLDELALLLVVPLCSFNYVVNIGFGVDWGRRPLTVSLAVLATGFALSWAITGSGDSAIAGAPLWLWLAYFYAHLGSAFVLAAVLATPGCEARAYAELFGRITGRAAAEHPCPAAFINRIDDWERRVRERR